MTTFAKNLVLTALATVAIFGAAGTAPAHAASLDTNGHNISAPSTRIIWVC